MEKVHRVRDDLRDILQLLAHSSCCCGDNRALLGRNQVQNPLLLRLGSHRQSSSRQDQRCMNIQELEMENLVHLQPP